MMQKIKRRQHKYPIGRFSVRMCLLWVLALSTRGVSANPNPSLLTGRNITFEDPVAGHYYVMTLAMAGICRQSDTWNCGSCSTITSSSVAGGHMVSVYKYTVGDVSGCPLLKKRSSTLTINCGSTFAPVSVSEPSTCTYSMDATAPELCAWYGTATASPSRPVSPTVSRTGSITPSTSRSSSITVSSSLSMSKSFSSTATRLPSVSTSLSTTRSLSSTLSISLSFTRSMSSSPLPSPSLSSSRAPSLSSSRAPSLSSSLTVAPSPSLSPSLSPSRAASPSSTRPPSLSSTPASSLSSSLTSTRVPSTSSSLTPSLTPSGSPSPTAPVSPSRAPSLSGSASVTTLPTSTATVSASLSRSVSVSISATPSVTAVASPTRTVSTSPSTSRSSSPSSTVTAPVTQSASSSASWSFTATLSSSQSSTATATKSTGASLSDTGTTTFTASVSSSISYSPTGTLTGTATLSATSSNDPSTSSSPSSSATLSATISMSSSSSGTVTTTRTADGTASPSVSASGSLSISPTPYSDAASFCHINDDELDGYRFQCKQCPPLADVWIAVGGEWWFPEMQCHRPNTTAPGLDACASHVGQRPGDWCDFTCGDSETSHVFWGASRLICDTDGAWSTAATFDGPPTGAHMGINCTQVSLGPRALHPYCFTVALAAATIDEVSVCNTTMLVSWTQPRLEWIALPTPLPNASLPSFMIEQLKLIEALNTDAYAYAVHVQVDWDGPTIGRTISYTPSSRSFAGDGMSATTVNIDIQDLLVSLAALNSNMTLVWRSTATSGSIYGELLHEGQSLGLMLQVLSYVPTLPSKYNVSVGESFNWFMLAQLNRVDDCGLLALSIVSSLSALGRSPLVNPYVSWSRRIFVGDGLPSSAIKLTVWRRPQVPYQKIICAPEAADSGIVLKPAYFTFSAAEAYPAYRTFQVVVSPVASSSLSPMRAAITCDDATYKRRLDDFGLLLPSPFRIDVVRIFALWPFFSDAVVELTGTKLKSSWSRSLEPVTLPTPLWNMSTTDMYASIRGVAGAASTGDVWQQTVSGQTNITLIAATQANGTAGLRSGFAKNAQVFIGGVLATVNWISEDGLMLRFQTPPFSLLCGDLEANCGQQSIIVYNNGVSMNQLQYLSTQRNEAVASGATEPLAVAISCPPFCPSSSPPSVTISTAAAISPLTPNSLVYRRSSDTAAQAGGMYYVSACVGFEDPAVGTCANTSARASSSCAWGAGDDCRECGAISPGVICPGGYRLWPVEGYYVPRESSGSAIECPVPESCLGWRTDLAAVECAEGYQQGSFACRLCANNYYKDVSGRCNECPSGTATWLVLRAILTIFGGLAAIGAVSLLLVWCATRRAGGTMMGGAKRVLSFLTAVVGAMQMVAQVGQAASAGLRGPVKDAYAAFAVFQFEFELLPPECVSDSASPFDVYVAQFATSLVLLFFVLLALLGRHTIIQWAASSAEPITATRLPQQVVLKIRNRMRTLCTARGLVPLAVKLSITGLGVLYALVCNSVFAVLACNPEMMPISWYATLVGDHRRIPPVDGLEATIKSGKCNDDAYDCESIDIVMRQEVTVPVLAADPYVLCWERPHQDIVLLGGSVFALFILFFPAASAICLQAYFKKRSRPSRTTKLNGKVTALGQSSTHAPAASIKSDQDKNRIPALLATPSAKFSLSTLLPQDSSGTASTVNGRAVVRTQQGRWNISGLLPTARDPGDADMASVAEVSSNAPAKKVDAQRPLANPFIAYFIAGDYRMSCWFFRHIDFASLCLLSLIVVFLDTPQTLDIAIAKGILQCVVIGAVLVCTIVWKPFANTDAGLASVKVYTMVLGIATSILNMTMDVVRVQSGPSAVQESTVVYVVSYIVVVLSFGLVVLVVAAFWYSILSGQRAEQKAEDNRLRLLTALSHTSMKDIFGVPRNMVNPMAIKRASVAARPSLRVPANVAEKSSQPARRLSSFSPTPSAIRRPSVISSTRRPSIALTSRSASEISMTTSSLKASVRYMDEGDPATVPASLVGSRSRRASRVSVYMASGMPTMVRKPHSSAARQPEAAVANPLAEVGTAPSAKAAASHNAALHSLYVYTARPGARILGSAGASGNRGRGSVAGRAATQARQ